jgi:hypothetical protein
MRNWIWNAKFYFYGFLSYFTVLKKLKIQKHQWMLVKKNNFKSNVVILLCFKNIKKIVVLPINIIIISETLWKDRIIYVS